MPPCGHLRLAVAAALAASPSAPATQHLVRPGADWSLLAARLDPGDEVILMPGRHRPVTLTDVRGTPEAPIVIRGLDGRNPPTIQAKRYGLRLVHPAHVRVADLRIVGATIHGIMIDGAPMPARAGADAEVDDSGSITLSHLTVEETGPTGSPGQRHALHLRRVHGVEIEACRIEGWTGTGIEIVACRDVKIHDCDLLGRDEHVQTSGIRIRAGSEKVRIERCRITNAGDQAVCIGGGSRIGDFFPPPPADAVPGSLFEASNVDVLRCVFRDGLSAIALVNCRKAAVRQCTIFRPRRAVLSVRGEQRDRRFGGTTDCAFGTNLIDWQPGDLTMLAHVGRGADTTGLSLEENLWWSPGLAEARDRLGDFPGTQVFPQVTDVDPALDEKLGPTDERAASFGAFPR